MDNLKGVILLHLKRLWLLNPSSRKKDQITTNLYNAIYNGDKTSEWRDMKPYWVKRLFTKANLLVNTDKKQDMTKYLKVYRIWFVVGYPTGNLPRLEADIKAVFFHPITQQLEIQFENVREVLA